MHFGGGRSRCRPCIFTGSCVTKTWLFVSGLSVVFATYLASLKLLLLDVAGTLLCSSSVSVSKIINSGRLWAPRVVDTGDVAARTCFAVLFRMFEYFSSGLVV